MDTSLVQRIKEQFALKPSAELREVLLDTSFERWSAEAGVAARQILDDRDSGLASEPEPPPAADPAPVNPGPFSTVVTVPLADPLNGIVQGWINTESLDSAKCPDCATTLCCRSLPVDEVVLEVGQTVIPVHGFCPRCNETECFVEGCRSSGTHVICHYISTKYRPTKYSGSIKFRFDQVVCDQHHSQLTGSRASKFRKVLDLLTLGCGIVFLGALTLIALNKFEWISVDSHFVFGCGVIAMIGVLVLGGLSDRVAPRLNTKRAVQPTLFDREHKTYKRLVTVGASSFHEEIGIDQSASVES